MEYEKIVNQNTPVVATTNPTNNLTALQGQNAINIPLQITPVVTQPSNNQIQPNQIQNVPTPVATQPQANNYGNYDFSNYKSQYQYNMPQFTPITVDANNTTEYKSQYANAINEMANQILNMRFNYNPNEDDLLKQAAKYTTQNTFESMNSKGILNSSLTAERVAKVVGELIPTYEKMARDEFESNFSMLMNTAQFIMNLDDTQYTRWENDRQQKWKEQQAEYEKAQNAIKNAWERVDELGYVDNEAAVILGVKVGTLSKDAREAKEQREWELKEWNRKQQIQQQAEKELLYLKQELQQKSDKELLYLKQQLQQQSDKELLYLKQQLQQESDRESLYLKQQLEEEQAERDFQRELQLAYAKANLSASSNSSTQKTTNLSTYDSIIKNRYASYDNATKKYIVTNKEGLLDYIEMENKAGRMSDNDALSLIAKYNLQTTNTTSKKTSSSSSPLVNAANTLLSVRR